MLATVAPFDGALHAMLWRGSVDADVISFYLRRLRRRFVHDFLLLFWDGAGAHISGELDVPAGVHIERLPTYSPELNPVEPLWAHLHERYIDNHLFPSVDAVEATLCRGLRDLAASPDLVRASTLFRWIKAASLTKK